MRCGIIVINIMNALPDATYFAEPREIWRRARECERIYVCTNKLRAGRAGEGSNRVPCHYNYDPSIACVSCAAPDVVDI